MNDSKHNGWNVSLRPGNIQSFPPTDPPKLLSISLAVPLATNIEWFSLLNIPIRPNDGRFGRFVWPFGKQLSRQGSERNRPIRRNSADCQIGPIRQRLNGSRSTTGCPAEWRNSSMEQVAKLMDFGSFFWVNKVDAWTAALQVTTRDEWMGKAEGWTAQKSSVKEKRFVFDVKVSGWLECAAYRKSQWAARSIQSCVAVENGADITFPTRWHVWNVSHDVLDVVFPLSGRKRSRGKKKKLQIGTLLPQRAPLADAD